MSATTEAPGGPTPSPIPPRPQKDQETSSNQDSSNHEHGNPSDPSISRPIPQAWPKPRIRLEIQDLEHAGARAFLRTHNPQALMRSAIETVLSTLYAASTPTAAIPPVKSITLVLRDMGGGAVAYTTGNSELGDEDHKSIHLNLGHIVNAGKEGDVRRQGQEIQGVFVHEMVHCWQWNGLGTCPGGLVEGIADYVRLKAGLEPPHWKREDRGTKWDAGYQFTAYFLEWAETVYGLGKVRELNGLLREKRYDGDKLWKEVFGKGVEELWEEFGETLERHSGKVTKG